MGHRLILLLLTSAWVLTATGCSRTDPPLPIAKSLPRPGDSPRAFNIHTSGFDRHNYQPRGPKTNRQIQRY
jgi:hypothetical protein